jgi:hypothetical protein
MKKVRKRFAISEIFPIFVPEIFEKTNGNALLTFCTSGSEIGPTR